MLSWSWPRHARRPTTTTPPTPRPERATTPDRNAGPEELFRTLSGLVTRTHHSQPSYKPGVHLYAAVDLQPNGQLRSIYTGDEFAPEDFIVDDARVEQRRKEALEARLTASTMLTRSHREAVEAEVEAEFPFNCEHVVPQSWFAKKEPMRGDLHHLFACEKTCNSFRGNTPYFDFSNFRDVVRERCGKTGVGRASHLLLPPPLPRRDQPRPGAGRGPPRVALSVASDLRGLGLRAAPQQADPDQAGKRNPLVDEPVLAGRIDFALGLG